MTDHRERGNHYIDLASQPGGTDAEDQVLALQAIGHYLGAILDELAIHNERLRQITQHVQPPAYRTGR